MTKKIKLMESQRELLRLKRLIVQDAIRLAEQKQAELQRAIETVALELGIDVEKERWRLSDDFSFFERMEVKDESKGKRWVSISSDSDLNWLNRDEEEVSWLKLRYLYTVPGDIVLFPLCLLGFFSGS